MSEIITEYHASGPCPVNIDALEKAWDHRFWLFESDEEFRLIQYLRRGSGVTKLKCTISNEQAHEIIARLNLVRTQLFMGTSGSWRKEGMSEWDMRRKIKTKLHK